MTTAICKIMLDREQAQAPRLMGMYPPVAISACLLFAAALEALRHVAFECGPGWQALYIYAYSSDCAVGIPCRNLGMQHVPSMRLLATVLGDLVAPFFIAKYLFTFDAGNSNRWNLRMPLKGMRGMANQEISAGPLSPRACPMCAKMLAVVAHPSSAFCRHAYRLIGTLASFFCNMDM